MKIDAYYSLTIGKETWYCERIEDAFNKANQIAQYRSWDYQTYAGGLWISTQGEEAIIRTLPRAVPVSG